MAIIYFVRHGQTEHNANHIIQGQIDSQLTELGKSQAEQTSKELKDIEFTSCYYSPLGRTTSTAHILLKHHNIEAHPKNDLMEFNMGILEGEINDHTIHGEEFENFAIYPHKYTTPVESGETYKDLAERVFNCCKDIVSNHAPDEKILIVSHGGPIRAILNPLINKPLSEFWLAPDVTPASISIVKWDKNTNPELITLAGTNKVDISYDNSRSDKFIRPN